MIYHHYMTTWDHLLKFLYFLKLLTYIFAQILAISIVNKRKRVKYIEELKGPNWYGNFQNQDTNNQISLVIVKLIQEQPKWIKDSIMAEAVSYYFPEDGDTKMELSIKISQICKIQTQTKNILNSYRNICNQCSNSKTSFVIKRIEIVLKENRIMINNLSRKG